MELFDLYDLNKNKVGKIIARGEDVPSGLYRLVVHSCIFNSENKMLIQQRSSNKSYPNRWDISAGGCVQKGETSQQAMQREIKEELGINIDLKDHAPNICFTFSEGFDDFYLIEQDLDVANLSLQKEEVQNARWASKEEIKDMINNGTFIKYHLSMIDFLFEIRGNLDIYKE